MISIKTIRSTEWSRSGATQKSGCSRSPIWTHPNQTCDSLIRRPLTFFSETFQRIQYRSPFTVRLRYGDRSRRVHNGQHFTTPTATRARYERYEFTRRRFEFDLFACVFVVVVWRSRWGGALVHDRSECIATRAPFRPGSMSGCGCGCGCRNNTVQNSQWTLIWITTGWRMPSVDGSRPEQWKISPLPIAAETTFGRKQCPYISDDWTS